MLLLIINDKTLGIVVDIVDCQDSEDVGDDDDYDDVEDEEYEEDSTEEDFLTDDGVAENEFWPFPSEAHAELALLINGPFPLVCPFLVQ